MAMLVAECRRDWLEIQRQMGESETVEPGVGDPQAALVALSLAHAYQAFETILLRIERALGLEERSGPSWHVASLADAAMALPGVRPPVLPAEASPHWQALLGFRNFLRHAYGVDPDPARLAELRTRLERAVALTEPWMEALLRALVP